MKVLDLFSGLDGWGAAFRDRGHQVVSLDLDPRFGSDFQMDILDLKGLGKWDVILASPPCETFSVASIGHHWGGGRRAYEPKTPEAIRGLAIARHTFALIDIAQPRWYVVENPRGVMRKLIDRNDLVTTWACQWSVTQAKPTDLWTNLKGTWPTCKNGNTDHAPAPRGSKTPGSTQGYQGAALRGLIPYALALAVCLACETDGYILGTRPELVAI
jgi:hypothetical protein